VRAVAVLVGVTGVAPGMGESALCAGLDGWLSGRGLRVDHFRGEELRSRAEFAAVAAKFEATRVVAPEALLRSVADFVRSVTAGRDDVVVADLLIPFTSSLLAWGHDDGAIRGFLGELSAARTGRTDRRIPGRRSGGGAAAGR
jgi:hypothetical protein